MNGEGRKITPGEHYIRGPKGFHIGDIDWMCIECDVPAVLKDQSRYGALDLRREDFICPNEPLVAVDSMMHKHENMPDIVITEMSNYRQLSLLDVPMTVCDVVIEGRKGTWVADWIIAVPESEVRYP